MNKSLKIREFVAAHPGAAFGAIADGTGVGRNFVSTVCAKFAREGKFVRDEAGGYSVNMDFVRAGGLAPKLRGFRAENRARKSGKKSAGKMKSVAEVARKHVSTPPGVSPLQTHALSTFAVLEQVIDLEGAEPMLLAAFKAHREALCLMAPAS